MHSPQTLRRWPFSLHWLLPVLILIALHGDVYGEDPQPLDIPTLIQQLDCGEFEARTEAGAGLISIGPSAIPPLLEAISGDSSLELQIRGCMVLKAFSIAEDPQHQQAGRAALDQLAAQKNGQAGQLARLAIDEISWLLYRRAIDKLTSLGAVFSYLPDSFGQFQQFNGFQLGGEPEHFEQVTFGEEWNGKPEDLACLKDLPTVVDFVFVGPAMNDAYFRQLSSAETMRRLICYQCAISHEGLAALKDLKQLALIAIGYSPVGKQEVEQLANIQSLKQASLFGTGIEQELIEELRRATHFQAVDVRGGAFMGITPMQMANDAETPGVFVGDLAPNSPGERAGLIPNDIIMSINGQEINDFEQLRTEIGSHKPGKKVVIKGLRDTVPFEKEVELAPWTVEDWKMRLPMDEQGIIRSLGGAVPAAAAVPPPVPVPTEKAPAEPDPVTPPPP